ncbi:hypothetical protein [Haloarchaeobius iranensis]|uniref:Uncharacterized protein n=1 Tax=Haloarchaeobius iranensis TaxID=996166 RepID=A0A1G9S9K4_9EURY|nr:hypothetical protein [Haloarchaeobius iranensis]SDM32136.1 hypothetical protein SAMN05192554_10131 [Haloarchaeobius iranensis]
MGLQRLVPLFVRYTLVGGALCTALLLGGTAAIVANNGGDVTATLPNVALASAAIGISLGAISFSTSNSGTETIEAGVAGGFDVTDPSLFRASTSGLPRRFRLGALSLGVGLFSAAFLAAVSTFG